MSHTVIFLIALDEDAIIGWLIASLSFKNYCQIASLYIDVEYRGMGLATRMLVYLESLTDYEYLWTEAFNDDELFVKSGFIKSDDQFFEKLTNHKRRNCYIKKIIAL